MSSNIPRCWQAEKGRSHVDYTGPEVGWFLSYACVFWRALCLDLFRFMMLWILDHKIHSLSLQACWNLGGMCTLNILVTVVQGTRFRVVYKTRSVDVLTVQSLVYVGVMFNEFLGSFDDIKSSMWLGVLCMDGKNCEHKQISI